MVRHGARGSSGRRRSPRGDSTRPDAGVVTYVLKRFAARCFLELSASLHFEVVVVPPPKPAGRGLKESLSPLEEVAKVGYGPLIRTYDVNREPILLDTPRKEWPDVIIVVDFGQKIKEPILSTPTFGCINIHPSLLPAYRGAAPIQRALMDGKEETGVTVFRLVDAMDAGPILAQRRYPISPDATAGQLCEALAREGSHLLLEVLEGLSKGSIREEPQDESEATYAPRSQRMRPSYDGVNPQSAFTTW